MTFTPAIPFGGLPGWAFLKRTYETQTQAFAAQTTVRRDEAYFRSNIGKVNSAEDLVSDPRLLRVALTAYGLQADMPNKFFVKKILTDGTLNTSALANRLANKQYQKLSAAFGFGDYATPRNKLSDFPDKLLDQYRKSAFGESVGQINNNFRLALNAETQLSELAQTRGSDRTKWFTVLGSPPLRRVFEGAFGFPTSFGAIDLDLQVKGMTEAARRLFGEGAVDQFADPDRVAVLIRRFLVRAEAQEASPFQQSSVTALTILRLRSGSFGTG